MVNISDSQTKPRKGKTFKSKFVSDFRETFSRGFTIREMKPQQTGKMRAHERPTFEQESESRSFSAAPSSQLPGQKAFADIGSPNMITSPAQVLGENSKRRASAAGENTRHSRGTTDLEVGPADMFQVGGDKPLAPDYISDLVNRGTAAGRIQHKLNSMQRRQEPNFAPKIHGRVVVTHSC